MDVGEPNAPAKAAPPTAPPPTAPAPPKEPTDLPPRAKKARPAGSPPLGRGGRQHTYLQNLIKEYAVTKGYHAVIEEPVLDGAGKVDVSLTKGPLRIACEISVTTARDYELGNIEKCLAAGYGRVLLVSADERHRSAMEKLVFGHLEDVQEGLVHVLDPQAALALIGELAGDDADVQTVRGYRVKVSHATTDSADAERRRDQVAAVIARSLRASGKGFTE